MTWFGNEVYAVGTQRSTTKYSTNGKPSSAQGPVGFEGLKGIGGAGRVETAGRDTPRTESLV